MSLITIAPSCGVTTDTLRSLIAGKVTSTVAMRLGSTSASLQAFVDGGTSIGLASALGTTSANLSELRAAIGKQGAIGLLIGLMAGSSSG